MSSISESLKDIAAGTGQPILPLAYIYDQVSRHGIANAQDIQVFISLGVPIVDAIASFMRQSIPAYGPEGVITIKTVSQRIKDEGIPLYIIDGAIGILTEPGGKFFNLSKHNQ